MKRRTKCIVAAACGLSMSIMGACGSATEDTAQPATAEPEAVTEQQAETATEAVSAEKSAEAASTAEAAESAEKVIKKPEPIVNPAEPHEPVDTEIFVKKIEGLSEDFICGMDASAVLAEENSGVNYYNYNGEAADVFETLAESGVNYIRLRVWNDPYDKDGNGYGGGNNDLPTAIELGKRATKYGMKVCIDFHYSDFWADPKRQHAPKAWEGMSLSEKADALYEFTADSMAQLLDAGVDVGMVQVGNEINYGMSGEKSQANVTKLLSSGSKAVREAADKYGKDIKVVIHYTNIQDKDELTNRVTNLGLSGVDYDIIGLSYYPFWNGDFEGMQDALKMIQNDYGKQVMLAETSYCYTAEEGDGTGNSISGAGDIVDGYPATVQGQANMLRDTMAAVNEAGGLGIFYWEGTWIPVGKPTDKNSEKWETYGSGWASSFAGDYDPDDAGLYYGGCSWDNQAMFSFDGDPLASLNVFKLIRTGSEAPLKIDAVPDVYLTYTTGDDIKLPEKADVIYNDTSKNQKVAVEWDPDVASKIDNTKAMSLNIPGTVKGSDGESFDIVCHLEIKLPNVVLNPGFEDGDVSMWQVSYEGSSNPTDLQKKADDAHTGDYAYHFWSGDGPMDFTIFQELTELEPGSYKLECFAQGGDMSGDSNLELFATVGDKTYTKTFMVTNWAEWKNPVIDDIEIKEGDTIKLGVHYVCNKGSWGTIDDFALTRN
ncbi:glycosyl hydrolase 53 family protein [Butyrivibrio sp. MC2021]|uniref:glycosyl hydrolase 53 family protein n=1 Tax=Butyrivibrio sp. MC2021 TaxID=1408306 RepID=UPI0006863AEE|nr:glycosyl hydrolase 53 family protein [Butyrivibrio sp. MC2021]